MSSLKTIFTYVSHFQKDYLDFHSHFPEASPNYVEPYFNHWFLPLIFFSCFNCLLKVGKLTHVTCSVPVEFLDTVSKTCFPSIVHTSFLQLFLHTSQCFLAKVSLEHFFYPQQMVIELLPKLSQKTSGW